VEEEEMIRNTEVDAPVFPTQLAAISTDRLLEAYAEAPARITTVLDGVSEEHFRARAVPGKWAIQEIALHLADSELVGAVRIRQVLAERRPDLPFYDQERFASGLGYLYRDAAFRRATLHEFRNLRETTGALLQSATPSDWKREGMHHIFGVLTLRQLLELYADHGERHIAQILELRRRLGIPFPMALLLPTLDY
jgi:uncharacterized damage-inducible protein DinB